MFIIRTNYLKIVSVSLLKHAEMGCQKVRIQGHQELRGFRSPSGVVSRPISCHSFDFFEIVLRIDRLEHTAQKVYRRPWPVDCSVARPFRVKSAY